MKKKIPIWLIVVIVAAVVLVFTVALFLVPLFIDVDCGIHRRLSSPEEQDVEYVSVNERNVMVVLIDRDDELFIDGVPTDLSLLKDKAKYFMTPRPNDITAPEVEIRHVELLGEVLMSKGVISLRNTPRTSYQAYLKVQVELSRAFRELKDELSQEYFHCRFDELDEEKQRAICDAVPVRISEAEPVND